MPQTRFYLETSEEIAKKLLSIFENAFEEEGYPVSAFENPQHPENWTLSVYADENTDPDVQSKMAELAKEHVEDAAFSREELPEVDWVAETLRELHPIKAGRFILHGSHDRDVAKSHEISILIDAGLAFGTGHHGTTAGCLDMLSRVSKHTTFCNILDLGTGSGVLAIAAAKLHQAHVFATDIDPVATETAKANARLNGVHAHMECITAPGFFHRRFGQQAPFDLVIANILAKPLQKMAFDIALHAARGATIILSGLLPHQRRMIAASFRTQNIMLERSHIRDRWLTMVLRKP